MIFELYYSNKIISNTKDDHSYYKPFIKFNSIQLKHY